MVAGAIPAAAWVSTPVVHADTADDAFIAVLDDQNIAYVSPSYAINAGHFVCLLLANGKSLTQSTETVYQFKQDARGNWYRTFEMTLWPMAGDIDPGSPVSLVMAPPGGVTSLAELVGP
jgi:hypothetical protein